ncbi:MAG: rRNA maturation RNase YbeY [Buchnera aphidicola (Meitanaphis microgallis)]
MTSIIINLQIACSKKSYFPKKLQYLKWVKACFKKTQSNFEITIRIVKKSEIKFLNKKYRYKNKTTNILSFPSTIHKIIKSSFIGDLVICGDIIKEEAKKNKKKIESHWAHIVIHGTLHLLGYDHKNYYDFKKMKKMEIKIMLSLGHNNPYTI